MGKVLKVLGIVFIVLVVGFAALLFWAHGEGEAQQKKFFDVVATGDPDKFIAMMDAKSIGPVDPPVIKMWMDWVNKKLGKYEGLAAGDFNTEKKMTAAGTLVESKGMAKFEKGQAEVRLTLMADKLVGFDVTSDVLKGNWLQLPIKGPLYRDRAKEFIKHLVDLEIETALAMTHEKLREKLTVEQSRAGMEALLKEGGKLENISVVDEQFIDGKEVKSLKIVVLCQFEKIKMLSFVQFDFDSVRGHLLAFKIPCTPEQAGVDPAKANPGSPAP